MFYSDRHMQSPDQSQKSNIYAVHEPPAPIKIG